MYRSAPLPPPPPQEPEEPEQPEEQSRVKKYSYFYLSRSLWYIPLYFTVYFVFYVTWLILQSIGRHEVKYISQHTHSINYSNIIQFQIDNFRFPYQITRKVAGVFPTIRIGNPLKRSTY